MQIHLYVAEDDLGPVLRILYLAVGNLLEVVTIERDVGDELAIHAMKMRTQYEILLPRGDRE